MSTYLANQFIHIDQPLSTSIPLLIREVHILKRNHNTAQEKALSQ